MKIMLSLFLGTLLLINPLASGRVFADLHSATQAPIIFYIVRHGETDWNIIGRIQGHADIPLNDTGRAQAMNLATQLQDLYFTNCYSSDLKRAFETAKIILNKKMPKIEIYSDKRLRERDFDNWAGKFFVDLNLAKPEEKLNIETNEEIRERVNACLEEIAAKEKNGLILILTHDGIIYNLLINLLKINQPNIKISIKNGGYFKLIFSENRWVIEELHNIEILEPSVL